MPSDELFLPTHLIEGRKVPLIIHLFLLAFVVSIVFGVGIALVN